MANEHDEGSGRAPDRERERQLFGILAAYFEAAEAGEAPDRTEWLARYPEWAEDIMRFLNDQDRLLRLTAPLRPITVAADESVDVAAGVPTEPTVGLAHDQRSGTQSRNGSADYPAGAKVRYVGDYELVGEIARGGMGVVFRARQRSLNRPVAVKMLLAGALMTDAGEQRFRQEAEAAANLDHPNIVPIFEVGRHDGHSYFSMKLIEGGSLAQRLPAFAADHRATARLIATVARTVHHAHQRGVLHRDLKPSNILLSEGPDIPLGQIEPHVTDFGLAKRVGGDSDLTQSGAILGTPSYMAPEQASGKKGIVTVATDVYGLGAVLYTILAGKPPFHGDSVLETIAQVKDRPLDPPSRHGRRIDRDLETICLKCLEKEPERRYSSAENLADDLERWMAGVPILRAPAGRVEHAWRWCRRNPAVALLTGAVASLVVLALAGLVVSNRVIARERDEAQRHRRQAEANFAKAREAVNDYLTKISEERLLNEPGMQPLRKDLLETALRYYREFVTQYHDDPTLQSEIADTSIRMGAITKMIGARPDALSSCQTALVIYRKLAQHDPDRIDFQHGVTDSLIKVGNLQYDTGDPTGAMTSFREAIALLERLVQAYPNEARLRDGLAKSHRSLGDLQNHIGEAENACQSFRRAIELWQGLLQVAPGAVRYQHELARSLILLGWLSPFDEAQQHQQRSREIFEKLVATNPANAEYQYELVRTCTNLGNLNSSASHFETAETYYQLGLQRLQRLVAANPNVTVFRASIAISQANIGAIRFATGEFDGARRLFQDALSTAAQIAESDPQVATYQCKLIDRYIELGEIERDTGDTEAARRLYVTAHDVATRLVAADPSSRHRNQLAKSFRVLGIIHRESGELESALRLYQQARAINPDLAETHLDLGKVERDLRLWQASARSYERAKEIWTQQPNQDGLATAYLELGHLKRATGFRVEASDAYGQAVALREKLVERTPTHFQFARALAASYVALGHLCHEQGQSEAAESWYEKATATYRGFLKRNPDNPATCNDLAWLLVTCPEPSFRDLAQALALARTAVGRSPQIGTFRRTLGIVYYRAGNWNETIAALKKATQPHRPGDASDGLVLAMAHWQRGDKVEARTWYTQAIDWMDKYKSQDDDLRRFRAEAEDLLGITDARMPNGIDAFRNN